MDRQDREQAVMSALTTEHFVLQMAANSTVTESGARATLYVMALSSSLIALGFSVDSEQAFVPLAATILPAVFVLGIFTVVRLVATSLQNLLCLGGIVRIHEHYRQLGPEAEAFFGTAGGEGEARATRAMLAIPEPGKLLTGGLFTAAAMVSGINSIVGGAGIALLVTEILDDGLVAIAVILGALAAVGFMVLSLAYMHSRHKALLGPSGSPWPAPLAAGRHDGKE
jgi:hypothetical protein